MALSSTLVIRALKLAVQTEAGEAGRVLRFTKGLNLLRADNSSGKSTALQAIIYALGLEGMLSASHRIPLPHAMTDRLVLDGVDATVRSSGVTLEIENGEGRVITIFRSVATRGRDPRLITVVEGGSITETGTFESSDYFVRASGAAQNAAGFHRFLAEFLKLNLPKVSKMDGSEIPLYLETLFPYFYVEQKHGWSGLQARMPNYLGIRDVGKRSAEYVLGLQAFERVLLRQRISSNLGELEAQWQRVGKELSEAAAAAKVVLSEPHGRISAGIGPEKSVPVVIINDEWVPMAIAVKRMEAALQTLADRGVPSVGEVAETVQADLATLESALQQTVAVTSSLWGEESDLEAQLNQLEIRIAALNEDLQRHKDSRTLQGFGSQHAHSMIADHICPTCHQDLEDGADISAHAMTIAENIEFIQRQLSVFEGSRADTQRVLSALRIRIESLVRQANDYRGDIRVAKETLSSSNSSPSARDIRLRLQVEERLGLLVGRQRSIVDIRESLAPIAEAWAGQKALLGSLSSSALSYEDESKLRELETSVRDQLQDYKFDSLNPHDIDIDRDTYRPINDGFDLGFDLSASDMIRVIWAYLFAFLKIGSSGSGAHLGLLIFDEPQQQQTARESYRALLQHAIQQGATGNQIIFATSETSESLTAMIGSSAQNVIDLSPGEKLLQFVK